MGFRYNIFKDFAQTKKEILKNEVGFFNEKHLTLISLVEDYFNSGLWSKNENDLLLWKHFNLGISAFKSSKYTNTDYNTLRSRMSRLNKKLLNILFDGRKLSDVCTSSEEDVLDLYIKKIKFLLYHLDFYPEVSSSLIHIINKIPFEGDNSSFSETEIFNALAFLAMHSKSVIEFQLNGLNIQALDFVINSLTQEEFTENVGYFKSLQETYKRSFNMKSETIQKIKNSV